MNLDSLGELFIEELKGVYDAEQQLLKEFPKISRAAFSEDLRDSLQMHEEQTKGQVKRLDQVFDKLKLKPSRKSSDGMKGIIADALKLLKEEPNADPAVLDAAIIAAAQRVEHFEIATYGTLRTYASTLGADEAAKLLQETLDEESATDRKLTELAEAMVNVEAAEADEEILRAAAGEAEEEDEEETEEERPSAKSRTSVSKRSGNKSKAASAGSSRQTKDHDEIRRWVEERGGKPATVTSTSGKKGEPGLLRIDFPGYSGGGSLEEIGWDEFFQKFDEENLTFLFQEQTKGGEPSNFNKLICGDADK